MTLLIATTILPAIGTNNDYSSSVEHMSHRGEIAGGTYRAKTLEDKCISVIVNPTDDAFIEENAPLTNFGDDEVLRVGYSVTSGRWRSYLQFDLKTIIPSDSCIISANLYLLNEGFCSNPIDVGVHYLSDDNWDESSLNWPYPLGPFNPVPTDIQTIGAIQLRKEIKGEPALGLSAPFSGVVSILFGLILMLHPGKGAPSIFLGVGVYRTIFEIPPIIQSLQAHKLARP